MKLGYNPCKRCQMSWTDVTLDVFRKISPSAVCLRLILALCEYKFELLFSDYHWTLINLRIDTVSDTDTLSLHILIIISLIRYKTVLWDFGGDNPRVLLHYRLTFKQCAALMPYLWWHWPWLPTESLDGLSVLFSTSFKIVGPCTV